MTHGGQEPPPPSQPPIQPTQPRLAASNPKSGRQLALIIGAMGVFFFALVVLAMWAAEQG